MRSLLIRDAVAARVALIPPSSAVLAACLALTLGCTKPDEQAAQPAAPSPSAEPTPAPSASVTPRATARGATKKGLPSCPAGTTLAWADNESAKCLRPCDGTDSNCPKGSTCTPGNAVGDDGNPIPHDIVDVCLPSAAAGAAVSSPDASTARPTVGNAMEVPNPAGAACPAGYGDQALLDTCNKSCKSDQDCTAPFTCQSLASDPPHNCVDLKHLHMRGAPP